MELEKFGAFMIRVSDGKVTSDHVINALLKQMKFAEGYKRLGEILVEENIICEKELIKYLDDFNREREKSKK